MREDEIGVGIIGMGFMGKAFAQICNQLPDFSLQGIVDSVESIGDACADQFDTARFDSAADLINSPDIQAIIVATPEDAHLAPCLLALGQDKSVLVEKPIADSMPNARRILDAAAGSSGTLLVGHVLRFATNFVAVKQMIDEGQIGDVQYIHTRRLNGKAAQDRLLGRCSLPVFLGVHDYDVARWIAQSEPKQVYAQSQFGVLRQAGYDIEDSNWAMITFENGVIGICETGWILPDGHPAGADQLVIVQGSNGRVELDLAKQGIQLSTESNTLFPDVTFMPWIRGELRAGFVHEVQHFARCIRKEATPIITGKDATIALEMALKIIESARIGQAVAW